MSQSREALADSLCQRMTETALCDWILDDVQETPESVSHPAAALAFARHLRLMLDDMAKNGIPAPRGLLARLQKR
ncbi:MAG TPA: hypothetical protein VGR25_08035 [bacterium]|nr:hypothetical protein [bacterium]